MASRNIAKRKNGKWLARYRLVPGGREYTKTFARKKDGEKWLDEQTAATVTGQFVDPSDKTTVAQYARTWAASRPHNPRTAKRTDSLIRNHIEGTPLGARQLKQVLPSEAQAWATGRAALLAASSAAGLVSLVRSIFKAAVLDRLVAVSPFARVTLKPAEAQRIVPLTVEQVRLLAEKMPKRCRAMVIVQAGLGLRLGELLALRADDVSFLKRTVRVEWQIPPDGTKRERPKTPLSCRTLPLPNFVAEALAAHMQEFPPLPDGTLFFNSHKKLWLTTYYGSKVFAAGVEAAELPEGTTSHDLRHHYASVLLHAGESVVAVAERLGHKNANLVIRVYGHLMPDSEERTRTALESAWRAADQLRTAGSLKVV
jgi:integrase